MAYRVVYGQAPVNKREKLSKWRITVYSMSFFLVFLLAMKLIWPDTMKMLCHALVPEGSEITQAAFSRLVADLRNGESFSEAVTVFCREIFANAQTTLH